MEGIRCRHNLEATRTGASCQLEGALVGLGTRVAEEDPTALTCRLAKKGIEEIRHLGADIVGEEVRDVREPSRLLFDRLRHLRAGMTQRDHCQAAEEVEILRPGIIDEDAPPTLDERHRRLGIGRHEV